MAQGGGKPSFFVPRGFGSKKMTLEMWERGRERVSFRYPINGEVLEVLYDRKWVA
jgi:hypothetical protein